MNWDEEVNIKLTKRNIKTINDLIIDWERQDFPNINPEASNYGVAELKKILVRYL